MHTKFQLKDGLVFQCEAVWTSNNRNRNIDPLKWIKAKWNLCLVLTNCCWSNTSSWVPSHIHLNLPDLWAEIQTETRVCHRNPDGSGDDDDAKNKNSCGCSQVSYRNKHLRPQRDGGSCRGWIRVLNIRGGGEWQHDAALQQLWRSNARLSARFVEKMRFKDEDESKTSWYIIAGWSS